MAERIVGWVWGFWLGWLLVHRWMGLDGVDGAWLSALLGLVVLRADQEEFDWSLAEQQMEGWRLRALERDAGGKYEVE